VILFSKAIIWSVFYFYSTSTNTECTDNVEGYFFASIAAAHLYVLLHGFSLVGPAFTTFGHMIKALLSYTVLLLAFNLYGTWALFINHTNETQACRDSYVFMLSRASNMIFYVFIVAAIVVFILAQCSTYNGCKCLRFSDLDETASDPEDDDDEKKDGAGSSSTAGAPASSQTLRSRRI